MAGMVAGVALAWTGAALAQAYPNKPIKFIITHAAGGLPDTVARIYAQRLSERLGQPVTVDNKPGANGMVAAQAMALAPKDGYTFMVTDGSTFSINPLISKSLSYDYKRDFVAVSLAARAPLYLAVHPKTPANNLRELIALAKAKPGTLTYGSSGNGTTLHLSGELFNLMSGSKITHIPYKGSTPAVADLMGGQISMIFDNMPSVIQQVKSGRLKALAVTSAQRNPQLPEVPTIQEVGVAGYEVWSWFGLLAPAATPQPIVDKLNASIVDIIKQPDVQAKIIELGAVPVPETSAEFGAFIEAETLKWAKVIKEANIGMD
jgi:tripartite-type tricarboxylate transporter receptor subunit TctC